MKDEDMVAPVRHLQPVNSRPEESDPWITDDGSYSRTRVYTRSVDSKGHKETFHVPVPPAVFGQVAQLVASKAVREYRTPQDFVRDAIVHRLRDIGVMLEDGSLLRASSVEQMLCDQHQMLIEMEELEKSVTETEKLMNKASQLRDTGMLEVLIERAEETLDDVREPYRSRLVAVIAEYKKRLAEQ